MLTIDTTNMCSHLQRKLFEEDGIYHHLWIAMQNDPELTAVVCSRQLHIYRNGKKVLVLAGKATPKVIREDKLCEILQKEATLLMLAVIGGTIGALLGMQVWRHKTMHKKFKYGLPLILLAQIALMYLISEK